MVSHARPDRAMSAIAMAVSTALALVGVALPGAEANAGPSHRPPVLAFDSVSIFVEQNATDGDTEVVIQGVVADEGFRQLTIDTPDGRRIVAAHSHDPSIMGLREFHFESPEPAGETILAAYPEGIYRFRARTHDGRKYAASAELSHELPPAATILFPGEDQEVGAEALTIHWSAGDGLSGIILELENESADPEQSLTIALPADTTSFDVPPAFLAPGAEMQVGIGTIAENGNIVFVEIAFTTAEE
jgi:hypothetical protein